MNDMQKGVVALIKSAVTQEAQPLPEGFAIDEAYNFIQEHKIMALAYDGAVRCGVSKENPSMQKLFQNYIQGMFRSEKQMKAVGEIYSAFNENGIDYLPLKGCNMKYLYPKPELRSMGDADILIKKEHEQKAEDILKEMGYTQVDDIDHHKAWHSSSLHLEIHRQPFSKNNMEYYSYYGDGWKFAQKAEGNRYCFSPEDEFIYIFTHFAVHCRSGGIGLRHAADFYVYRKAFPFLDEKYLEEEIKKLHLFKFYKNVSALMNYWFEEGERTEEAETLSDFILSAGDWGNYQNALLSSSVKEQQKKGGNSFSKTGYLIKAVFPSLEIMQINYPYLQKHPVFLPVFWVRKWFDILLLRRKSISGKLKVIGKTGSREVSEYEEKMKIIGIDYKDEK